MRVLLTGSAGFNGIVTALFGGLHPLWTIPSSFFFGGLQFGANAMQRAVQVPAALIVGLNGLVVVFVVSSDRLRRAVGESFVQGRRIRDERIRNERATEGDPSERDGASREGAGT